jgi:hypothetical protein
MIDDILKGHAEVVITKPLARPSGLHAESAGVPTGFVREFHG